MDKVKLLKLLVSLILPTGLACIAGIFTVKEMPEWYAKLKKHSFNPQGCLFGPGLDSILYTHRSFYVSNLEHTKKSTLAKSVNCFWHSIIF